MELTERYKLKKPGQDDHYDVQDFNDNADAIDAALGQHDEGIDNVFRVGDLRSTLRTDLGDRWLLCNGEAFDPADYPELAAVIPGGLAAMGTKAKSRTVGTPPVSGYGPGAYATDGINQLAAYGIGAAGGTNKVYWSKDNFKTYTAKTITPAYGFIRLFFANGHWIAFIGDSVATSPSPARFTHCCVQSEPFSNFSSYTDLQSSNTAILDVFHVEYINGSYYAFCATYDMAGLGGNSIGISFSVLVSDSPDFHNVGFLTAWSDAYVFGSSYNSNFGFCRTEDKFVFFAYEYYWRLVGLAWSATPTGAYQQRTISADGQSAAAWMSAPLAIDGKFVWVRTTIPSSSSTTYSLSLAYLSDIESGTMGYVSLDKSATSKYISNLVDCGDGTYAFFAHGQSYIYVGTGDILQASNWTRGSLSAAPNWEGGTGIAYAKDGGVSTSKSGGILDIPRAAVPTVSISNCYTYIKAK